MDKCELSYPKYLHYPEYNACALQCTYMTLSTQNNICIISKQLLVTALVIETKGSTIAAQRTMLQLETATYN